MHVKKKNRHKKQKYRAKGTVTISPLAFLIGLIGLPFCLLLFVGNLLKGDIWTRVISGFFVLLDMYLLLSINWKIDYDSNGFTYRNLFRISKYYRYSEITKIYRDKSSYIIVGRKKIFIDSMTDGGKHFLIQAQRRAKQANQSSAVNRKLFNGNVRNAGEFVFFFFLIIVLIIGAWSFILISYRPLKLENLEKITTRLSDSREGYTEKGTLYLDLISEQDEMDFRLSRVEERNISIDLLREEIQNGESFTIYYESFETVKQVRQLVSEHTIYLSIQDINTEYAETRFGLSLLFGIILGIFVFFGLLSNHIMSHAEKYPNAIRWFVKEEYIIHKNHYK